MLKYNGNCENVLKVRAVSGRMIKVGLSE